MRDRHESYMLRRVPYRVSVWHKSANHTLLYDADSIPDCCAIVGLFPAEIVVYSGPKPIDQYREEFDYAARPL